ncbi:MAG TPA: hypothetical protein VJO99_15370 [Burkholderiaceae bacterium]|nr:hypothetical protein [Burkholderiaceae bacterium]
MTVTSLTLALLMAIGAAASGNASAASDLACTLRAPPRVAAGAPVPLRFTFSNRSAHALRLLEWGTPLEGWFAAYVEVTRDGVALPYRGPMIKRGDPGRDEYQRIAAHRTRSATVNLAQPFDLSQPGVYRVTPRITLFDVVVDGATALPRSREQQTPQALACNAVEIRVDASAR